MSTQLNGLTVVIRPGVAEAGLVAVHHTGRFDAAKGPVDDRQVELPADAR
jgi:hypothetical protein